MTGDHFFLASGVDKMVDDLGKAVTLSISRVPWDGSNRNGSSCTVRLAGNAPHLTPCSSLSYGDSISTFVL